MSTESSSVPTSQTEGDSLTGVNHRVVETNGIHDAHRRAGRGPAGRPPARLPGVVVLVAPPAPALAEAGYHAVAPDQRGYGQTDRPAEVEQYTQLHLVGDVVGLLDALGEERAVVVGHDWGAPVAWNTALLRPDRVRGVAGLSVPYVPRGPVSMLTAMRAACSARASTCTTSRSPASPTPSWRATCATTLRRILYRRLRRRAAGQPSRPSRSCRRTAGFLDVLPEPDDAARLADGGRSRRLRRRVRAHRLHRRSELVPDHRPQLGADGAVAGGGRDAAGALRRRRPRPGRQFPGHGPVHSHLQPVVPNLTRTVLLPGVGHWTQQERPAEVNAALLEFLAGL